MGDRKALLARSWDQAAELYTTELAPRFLPYINHGLQAISQFRDQLPAAGSLALVPCCGPGERMGRHLQ